MTFTEGREGAPRLATKGGPPLEYQTVILDPLITLLPYGDDELTCFLSLAHVTTTTHLVDLGIAKNRKRANEQLYALYLKGALKRTQRNPWTQVAPHRPPYFYYTPAATEDDIQACVDDFRARFVSEHEQRAEDQIERWECLCGYRVQRLKTYHASPTTFKCPTCKIPLRKVDQ